jgi:hypothetical protein
LIWLADAASGTCIKTSLTVQFKTIGLKRIEYHWQDFNVTIQGQNFHENFLKVFFCDERASVVTVKARLFQNTLS